jgi:hypothetical protein
VELAASNDSTSESLLLLMWVSRLILRRREDECTPCRAVAGGCLGNGATSLSLLLLLMWVSRLILQVLLGREDECTPPLAVA